MLEVRQDPMRYTVPALCCRLVLQTALDVVIALAHGFKILRSHWLMLEGVTAVVACRFPLGTLGQLAD
jgi:hypothetical protein